jgi:hypothetical protein
MTREEKIEIFGKSVAFLALLASIVTFLLQQVTSARVSAEEKSLEYADEFRRTVQPDLSKLKVSLAHYTRYADINDAEVIADADFAALAEEVLFGVGDSRDGFVLQLEQTNNFFLSINVCHTSKVCDAEVLEALLCKPAEALSDENARLIAYYATSYAGEEYVDEVALFARTCRR